MRPLYHPPIEEISVQGILYALSDPVRVRIFVGLVGSDCAKNCATLAGLSDTPVPKSTLSQHFNVLREAGLIRSERKGVEMQNTSRYAELVGKFGPMIQGIMDAYQKEAAASSRSQV